MFFDLRDWLLTTDPFLDEVSALFWMFSSAKAGSLFLREVLILELFEVLESLDLTKPVVRNCLNLCK